MLCPCAGSAAIELFPYHFDHTLYFAMAKLAGVGMFPVHSTNGTNTFRNGKVLLVDKFLPALDCVGVCDMSGEVVCKRCLTGHPRPHPQPSSR